MHYGDAVTGSATVRGLVGRQHELSELERILAAVVDGRSRFAVVEGPVGIGKTALVEEFLARQNDIEIGWAGGAPWERSLPFGVAEQLHRNSGDPAPLPPPSEQVPEPVSIGLRLLHAWRHQPGTMVVVVDDAHWADLASLQALSSAYRRTSSEKVLILLIARDDQQDEPSGPVREFLARHRGPTLPVGPLKTSEVQALAMQSAGVDLSSSATQRLAEHTGGNPSYIKQLLREMPSESWLGWQPALPAPRSLAADVLSRMRACGPQARALVESAAVLGHTLSFAEAADLAEIQEPVAALDEASRAGLVTTMGGHGLTTLAFPSPMVRAAVYTDLTPLRRQELHRRAAKIVDEEGTRLAHRVALSPFPDEELAGELDAFAARQAATGAWSAVSDALVNASRLSPARADRAHRLVRAVDALVGAGDLPQAIAFAPAIESFPPSPIRDAVLGYLAILLGRPAEAEMLLTRAWQQCNPKLEPDTAALICQRRVLHSMARWRGPDLVGWGRRAIELATRDDPPAVESEAIMGLGLAAGGRIEEAKDAYEEVLGKISPGAQLQRVQMGKGWLDLALDDHLNARRELHGAVPTEYRQGSTRISLWAQAWLARTEFALGAWDDAIHTVNRAVARMEQAGLELVRPLVHWTGAQTHALRGNWDAAQDHLQHASATTHDYEVMLIPACLARAQCAETQADYETVLRVLEPLVQLRPRQGIDEPGFWPWHDVYANALVVSNRIEEAENFLKPHEALAAQRGHRSTMARLGYVRGRISGALGDIGSAKESFEGSLAQLQGMPLPYERARVNFAYGQTLRRAGKRREADVVLHNARDAYATLGARAYVQRCDRELKAGGLHAKRGGDLTRLTGQEQAVAKLVAAGMSNKQAAVELFVSVKTVQFHLTRIYGKLGIGSRGELAARFRDEPGADGT